MDRLDDAMSRSDRATGREDDTAVQGRRRVALAVCASPDLALRVADRLMQAGVGANGIAFGTLAGRSRDALAAMVASMPDPRPSTILIEEAGSPMPDARPAGAAAPLLAILGLDGFLTPELATATRRHLGHGAVIVAVLVPSPRAERRITDILLRASIGHVQLHDIA